MNAERRARFDVNDAREHRWVISYADFLTLLFAFFVFLFSISSLEVEKYQQVSATLLQLFDVAPSSIEPIELAATPEGPDIFNPLYQPEPLPGTDIDVADTERYSQASSLLDIQASLNKSFEQLIEGQLFSVSGDEAWIEIQIANSILFSSGAADISDNAEAILYEIGKLLSGENVPIAIEGYSEIAEAATAEQGWSLSSQRAINVLLYLQRAGIAGERLSSIAFSHYQPDSTENIAGGARVSIVVAGFEASVRR
ncbi:MAG: flagellar motor protein MotB [Reinekea sp.]|jgi:chemotaxis protein MotB